MHDTNNNRSACYKGLETTENSIRRGTGYVVCSDNSMRSPGAYISRHGEQRGVRKGCDPERFGVAVLRDYWIYLQSGQSRFESDSRGTCDRMHC